MPIWHSLHSFLLLWYKNVGEKEGLGRPSSIAWLLGIQIYAEVTEAGSRASATSTWFWAIGLFICLASAVNGWDRASEEGSSQWSGRNRSRASVAVAEPHRFAINVRALQKVFFIIAQKLNVDTFTFCCLGTFRTVMHSKRNQYGNFIAFVYVNCRFTLWYGP